MSARQTALFALHKSLQGNMVPFAGYLLPIQYPKGSIFETQQTREKAGLFDVSHMGQIRLVGADAPSMIKRLTPVNYYKLKIDQASLSMFLTETGGILDDCIVTKGEKAVSIVINASRVDEDLAHIRREVEQARSKGQDVELQCDTDRALLALQGPRASAVLSAFVGSLDEINFMNRVLREFKSIGPVSISRCGYTGEDGFEISVPNDKAAALAEALLGNEEVSPCGLGSRDILRLEAGLCLYGNDLDTNINPVAAKLMWCVAKPRLEEADFIGAAAVKAFAADASKVPRLRVGLTSSGPVPRKGMELKTSDGNPAGIVTSGGFSPTLQKNVAMAYVDRAHATAGTTLQAQIRGELKPVVVTVMPFVLNRYYKRVVAKN